LLKLCLNINIVEAAMTTVKISNSIMDKAVIINTTSFEQLSFAHDIAMLGPMMLYKSRAGAKAHCNNTNRESSESAHKCALGYFNRQTT
jgi:hypothetical protein